MKQPMKLTLILILVLAIILGGLYWYSYHVGEKEEIDRTLDAIAILEDGTELPCTVRFLGTRYIGHPEAEIDQFHGGNDGGIWINNCKVLNSYGFHDASGDIRFLKSDNGAFYLNPDMTIFAAEVDTSNIFPDMESQTAYVILKNSAPEEYEPILDMMRAD